MTPLDTTRTVYEHAKKGEWDRVSAYMTGDFVIHEPTSLPYGGEWRGSDALKELFTKVMGFWENPAVEWIDLVGGEDHVVALLQFSMTVPGTGEKIVQRVAEVTRFANDGKMAEMHVHYFDTSQMTYALERMPQKS